MNSRNNIGPSRPDAKIPFPLGALGRDIPSVAWKSEPVASVPFISVIVPVRNEADHIQRTLIQLLTQNYDCRRFEVLVADGQSTDGTWGIVAALQMARLSAAARFCLATTPSVPEAVWKLNRDLAQVHGIA